MVNSMTGFGRGVCGDELCSYVVEIKSVNHRFLEVSIKMPRNLISLEEKIRAVIKSRIIRGKVDVYITEKNYNGQSTKANLNLNLAKSYIQCLETLKENFDMRDDFSISTVARFPEVITLTQEEENLEKKWSIISSALNDGIEKLLVMRKNEGTKLNEDIMSKCNNILSLVSKVSERSPMVVGEYKEKLSNRIKELLEGKVEVDESRLAMEIAIFADKASIDEEITRLKSHVNQLKDALDSEESVGRKLDFIVQEMNRESNTIASKANDLHILKHTLELKSEIEKIREQVQNIE
ncbi:TIGR00255 family protein [Hathewaya proteolytica DSM 3090]|uniref:TIGR00255 family protein n=1 Tax=Hathewaya proteolytica DSM 3090 TaxID=1121331 RepID=A0A1M6JB17_9CLOT|nr:YicC/YloC family endoribonuclease [Hathewaya proteolytica]SHJ43908.1 TIGR00255 family protein [Hathewaya proteolytica DSM 3090]